MNGVSLKNKLPQHHSTATGKFFLLKIGLILDPKNRTPKTEWEVKRKWEKVNSEKSCFEEAVRKERGFLLNHNFTWNLKMLHQHLTEYKYITNDIFLSRKYASFYLNYSMMQTREQYLGVNAKGQPVLEVEWKLLPLILISPTLLTLILFAHFLDPGIPCCKLLLLHLHPHSAAHS